MYLRLFLFVSVLGLSILPAINLTSDRVNLKEVKTIKLKKLYNTDSLETFFNQYLINYGVSMNPQQTMIGKKHWFFLGDNYSKTISAYRNGSETQSVQKSAAEIVNTQTTWKRFYTDNGVKDFKIIVGPNKSTIYSEYLPKWAQSNSSSISNNLYRSNIYIDSRSQLIESKGNEPLYYYSDTHWNMYGAGIAFNNFIDNLSKKNQIIAPPKSWGKLIQNIPKLGGDLASFLKIQHNIKDVNPITAVANLNIDHVIYDFNKNIKVYEGLGALYGNMNNLYLIKTPNALNDRKVLWLSDSYGNALAPYMTATFSNVLKQHWGAILGTTKLEQLVKKWQPDYVFITVVERDSFSEQFKQRPSPTVLYGLQISPKAQLKEPHLNHIKRIKGSQYIVNGPDPFLVYDFKQSANGLATDNLSFKLECKNYDGSVPIQLFWQTTKMGFNEPASIRFNAKNGVNQFFIPSLVGQNDLNSIRIDLDGIVQCKNFSLSNVKLGSPSVN